MVIREVRASGMEAINLATVLLQRARQAHATNGLWEAADVQWAWRKQRLSDDVEKVFWLDEGGPVAGILVTSEGEDQWQFDPVLVPGNNGVTLDDLWAHAMSQIARIGTTTVEIPIRNDDPFLQSIALAAGFTASGGDRTAWMEASRKPPVSSLPEGFRITDRSRGDNKAHPMRRRNGAEIGSRLQQCSLYAPALDLAVETIHGDVAGYSLFWFDPVTLVGLVEPVRVEDDYQRRGLARAMLTEGISRLAARGATRIKISWETEKAGRLYEGIGFQPDSSTTWYRLLRR